MSLSVIGPGFGRTGSHSLKLALERLGFGPCHHMYEVANNPEQLDGWMAASEGKPVDWKAVFAGYGSQTDWPGAHFWREIVEAFPEAKVVLTTRDPDNWYDSAMETIFNTMDMAGKLDDPRANKLLTMAKNIILGRIFPKGLEDREHVTGIFKQHIEDVKQAIPQTRLLTYDVKEGWPPLCAFLGVPVPDEPFPHTNTRDEFWEKLKK